MNDYKFKWESIENFNSKNMFLFQTRNKKNIQVFKTESHFIYGFNVLRSIFWHDVSFK